MNLVKPKKLCAGDTVAIVSPSWGGPGELPERYEIGKKRIMDVLGVNVVEMPNALKPADWVHNNPKARAEDFMQAFADPEINGIIASIGGDDCVRLLPYLDFEVIKNNPKVFMGYSDTTIMHFACMKAGLSSFYGPCLLVEFAENCGMFPYSIEEMNKTILSDCVPGDIPVAQEWSVEELDWSVPENQERKRKREPSLGRSCLQGNGIANGHLIGGCLDVFPMLLGTSLWPEAEAFDGAVLFVETSEEAPPVDDIKRLFRNFGVQGILEKINGVLIGRPGGGVKDPRQYDAAIHSVISEEFRLRNLPVITQMDFGHTSPICVLPYGAKVEIDCNTCRVSLIENVCR